MTVPLQPFRAPVPSRSASPGPTWLRLDAAEGAVVDLDEHLALHGELPAWDGPSLLDELERSGLTGRGGAAFPMHRKLRAVAAGAAPRVVVAKAAEGEPASRKDKTLLGTDPHLVLDGLQLAAAAVEAASAYLYVHTDLPLLAVVNAAIRERAAAGVDTVPVEVVCAPPAFVSGEESAVVSRISGGPAKPRPKPPRVFESGVHGRPTAVCNAETLAHLAVLARRGADAFRACGVPEQPGTMLFTVSGAVHRPGVVEAPVGTTLDRLLAAVGGPSHHVGAVLVGGYHGGWLPWPHAREVPMSNAGLQPYGLSAGAGVVVVLPADVCGVAESARVLDYLAAESAGQCGPCVFGMPRLATTFGAVARGSRRPGRGRRLDELALALERRGGCHHPDGSVRFLRSVTRVFADELREHRHGRCSAVSSRPLLPTG